MRSTHDRARLVDPAAPTRVERGTAVVATDLGQGAPALGWPRGDVRADRGRLDRGDRQADVTAVAAATPALHVVAVARLDAGEEAVDLGGQLVVATHGTRPSTDATLNWVWARVHKIDRVRPRADGSAIVLVEDERNVAAMSRIPGLSTVVAIARVLDAKRALELKFEGKGEVRYASRAALPDFLLDAVTRAGAASVDRGGDKVRAPAAPASVGAIADHAFATFAYHLRAGIGGDDMAATLRTLETRRRKAPPIDRDAHPAKYWTAVFELMALAGEVSRPRGGMWVDTRDMPVPYALRFPDGALAHPAKVAIQIVEGTAETWMSVSDAEPAAPVSSDPG